jgi:hypothetical protein
MTGPIFVVNRSMPFWNNSDTEAYVRWTHSVQPASEDFSDAGRAP